MKKEFDAQKEVKEMLTPDEGWDILQRIDNAIKERLEQVDFHLIGKSSPETINMINELKEDIHEIKDILKPISATYNTIHIGGKWIGAVIVFLATLSGIFWGWWEFFKHK